MDETAEHALFRGRIHLVTLLWMALKGAAYIGVGLTWLLLPSQTRAEGIAWLEYVTPEVVGWLWIGAGLLGVVASRLRAPSVRFQQAGWAALIATPTIVGFYFFVAWLQFLLPGGHDGTSRGITTTIYAATFALSAYLMARVYALTLPEPPHKEP